MHTSHRQKQKNTPRSWATYDKSRKVCVKYKYVSEKKNMRSDADTKRDHSVEWTLNCSLVHLCKQTCSIHPKYIIFSFVRKFYFRWPLKRNS